MKKELYSLLFMVLPLAAAAQPTLTVAQDYNVGTIIQYKKCNPVSPAGDGASQTWNFTTLTALGGNDTLTATYDSAGTVYTGATVLEKTTDSMYTYLAKTVSTNAMVAFADSSSAGGNVTLTFLSNNDIIAKRPLTYMLNNTDTFSGNLLYSGFTIPTSGNNNTTNISVTGFGTLHLPSASYTDVLKIRSEHHQTNSITSPAVVTVNVTMVSYMWFDASHKAPLLRIDSFLVSGSPTPPVPTITRASTDYLLKETYPSNVPDVPVNKMDFSAYIENETLILHGNFATKDYQLFLTNIAGQTLYTTEFSGGQVPLHFNTTTNLPHGVYMVTLLRKDDISTLTTIKIVKE